jgi:F-type H+-transporting ATPase subunit b
MRVKALVFTASLLLVVWCGLGVRRAAADLRPEPEASDNGAKATEHREDQEDPSKDFNYINFRYPGHDAHGHLKSDADYDSSEPMSPPFILALVNFAVFLAILARYGGPAASKLAAERHDQIKGALDEAKQLRDKAAGKLADYEKRIANLDGEIAKLVEGIKADAAADKARILAAADAQAAAMKRDAELRIAAELEYARAALTREVTIAATRAAEQLLSSRLQPADQEKLVATFIADVEKNAAPPSRPEAKS